MPRTDAEKRKQKIRDILAHSNFPAEQLPHHGFVVLWQKNAAANQLGNFTTTPEKAWVFCPKLLAQVASVWRNKGLHRPTAIVPACYDGQKVILTGPAMTFSVGNIVGMPARNSART